MEKVWNLFQELLFYFGYAAHWFSFIWLLPFHQVKSENFKPLLYNGWDQTVQSTMLFLGRSTGIATLAILLPATKGNKTIGFTVWNVVTYLLMSIIMVIMVGVLGNAIQTQMFPMHTLAGSNIRYWSVSAYGFHFFGHLAYGCFY